MTYVNAGHTMGLLRRRDGTIHGVLGDNLPVGVVAEERYVEATEAIAPGDALLVYSDGLTEARNVGGVEFGADRLFGFLEGTAGHALPASICVQALRRTVRSFVGARAMADDQTAVLVGFRETGGSGGVAPNARSTMEFDLPWDPSGLQLLRKRVAEASSMLENNAADLLVLGVFEAATNVIRHVPRPFPEATICCRVDRQANAAVVELWYLGDPFVPPADPQPDLSGDTEGGFGLYIMSQAVSRVCHESPLPGICCTRLTQSLADPVVH